MKTYKLFFKPDRAVQQFKRLRFEEVEVPLRDVLTRGCHPVGACHYRGSPKRDTSHAAEAVVNKLNEDDARVAALKDFGYSHDLHTTSPPSRYAYCYLRQRIETGRSGPVATAVHYYGS